MARHTDPSAIRTLKELLGDWQYWAGIMAKLDDLYDCQRPLEPACLSFDRHYLTYL